MGLSSRLQLNTKIKAEKKREWWKEMKNLWKNIFRLQSKATGLNRKWRRGLGGWGVVWFETEKTGGSGWLTFGAELTSCENRKALPDNHTLPQRCLIADLWTVVFSCAAFYVPLFAAWLRLSRHEGAGRHTPLHGQKAEESKLLLGESAPSLKVRRRRSP